MSAEMERVTPVPETSSGRGDGLTADDAWRALRSAGIGRLTATTFRRFRFAGGFSHARALGLQLSLAVVPLMIAVVGLSGTVQAHGVGRVLTATLLSLTPGGSDAGLGAAVSASLSGGGDRNAIALWVGLLTSIIALTTCSGEFQRSANRIYGITRDRPTRYKYGRGAVLAATAGVPALLGSLLLIAAGPLGDAVEAVYGRDDDIVTVVGIPVGLLLVLGAVVVLMRGASQRTQPPLSWLAVGGLVAFVLWCGFTASLGAFLQLSTGFATVYGPLTGVMALLLWAQLSSVAVLLGMSFSAQLEAIRAGRPDPLTGGSP